ncbi:MAG: hypothetical protein COC04_06170 [Gammaproteobacteria bacterium]|nr:MAG: hypothetical protein COC04_06170 [Gammaproteobacteria bacterium]
MSDNDHLMHEGEHDFVSEAAVIEEKRRRQRREAHDRRDMIRFELDNDDRRSGKDRRTSVTDWGTDQPV